MNYSQKTKQQLLMITLNAAKAFHRVLWPFIFETCKKFKLDEKCISWLQMMYKTPYALIFILAIEPSAEKIRNNYKIKGRQTGRT